MSLKFYVIGRERRRAPAGPVFRQRERRGADGRTSHYIGLRDRRVSRRHAELYVLEDRIFIRDLGSKNGTFVVEGKKAERLTEGYVHPEQILSFGGNLHRVSGLLQKVSASGPNANGSDDS